MVVWAFPLRVGLSATSPRYAVAFPLQSLTWVKGFSLSCACTLAHGLFRPGVRFRPLRQAAWPKPDIGRKDKRNTSVRAVTRGFVCSPKLPVPRPVRKSSPAFVRQPEADRPPILPSVSPCLGKRAFPALRKASFSCTRQVTYQ